MNEEEDSTNTNKKQTKDYYLLKVFLITFFISILLSLFSNKVFSAAHILILIPCLLMFVIIGVVGDAVGVAITATSPEPFNAMCTKKVKGAKEVVDLLKNADKVANFCSDIIGDVVGIVSGSAAVMMVENIIELFKINNNISMLVLNLFLTALVSSLTIMGKALGKTIAMNKSKEMLLIVGKIIYLIKIPFSIIKKNKK